MANLLVDGFDWFPSGQGSAARSILWAANNMFAINAPSTTQDYPDVTTGRFGFGQAMAWQPSTGDQMGYVIPIGATPQTGFFGFALYCDKSQTASSGACFYFYDAVTNAPQICIKFAKNGVVQIFRGDSVSGTLLANSLAGSWQEDEWFHAEIKATIASAGAGSVEVRINTVPVVQLVGATTQATANAYFDSVGIEAPHNSLKRYNFLVDDMFVNDTTGAQNNSWSGNLRVKTQFMIANGATDQFTIGGSAPAPTNWQSVLNQSLDDTEYVYDSNVGDIDLYTPDPNLNSPLVRSLQVRMALRQDDATQRAARAVLRIGGTNYPAGADEYTNQTYTFYKQRWELNPATGVSFTGADVNGLQAGIKLTI